MPPDAAWKSLTGIAILLSFPAVTSGDVQSLSFDPDPPRECEPLTFQWVAEPPATVVVFGRSGLALSPPKLFQAVVTARTGSLEWMVNATGGTPVGIALSMDMSGVGVGIQTDRTILSATSPCSSPVRDSLMYLALFVDIRRDRRLPLRRVPWHLHIVSPPTVLRVHNRTRAPSRQHLQVFPHPWPRQPRLIPQLLPQSPYPRRLQTFLPSRRLQF